MQKSFSVDFGGKKLVIETGKYAQAANGSCLVRYGDTVVLATAVMSKDTRAGLDFFPLMVEYEEKLYAAGRIKGSRFIKREGRPTDEAVLTARFIDRAIRPLFDQNIHNDVQIICSVLAFDGQNDPDIPALIAASCAVHISDIPWNGPIAAARINFLNDNWLINGSYADRSLASFDVEVAGTTEKVIMMEAGCDQASEESILQAIELGRNSLGPVIDLINKVRDEVGKPKKDVVSPKTDEDREHAQKLAEVKELMLPFTKQQIQELFFAAPKATKNERSLAKDELKSRVHQYLKDQGVDDALNKAALGLISEILDHEVSRSILEDGRRVDGRELHEIRPLTAEVGVLPCVHGSGYFTRGETQVLSVCTLGAPGDKQTSLHASLQLSSVFS
jgi:polyribonucleotide nucleotidyltransferase